MSAPSTRSQIIEAADDLFYRQGFEHTSFAHIADVVGISRGNFYHHFKTKDEILDAVIGLRVARTEAMLTLWENQWAMPAERILSFIRILIANQTPIMAHGCPVGSLCSELSKLAHPALVPASELFTLFRVWLARQFEQAGRGADAGALAMHLLARSQGVAVLAQTFHDAAFVQSEVAQMEEWLDSVLPQPVTAEIPRV
ncbi:TetR/AcrR family transcriptional regulator [Rhodoferax sp.]|uniref:TetR/AcrR family transcriptional regulator n=1 Tax=Rhodoferax sp. TaxID=50421 RepID=UPI002840217D|nr:TetR/AcrR family transcriptional regulator [Rhodoferax sp.]MDR3369756.1 TetR/AcrR family transcriptional regulator [Rhodoferax sp.]